MLVKASNDAWPCHHCIPVPSPLTDAALALTQDVVMNEQMQALDASATTISITDSAKGSLNIANNYAGDCMKTACAQEHPCPEPHRPNLSRGLARPSSKGQGGNVACVRAERESS